jgi:anti-anti-sigma factor
MAVTPDGKRLFTPVWRLSHRTVVENGTVALILEGRLGHASAPQLKAMVEGAAQDSKDVVLDLAGIDYLSSAALKVIEESGLMVRSPSPAARLSLDLAGLSHRTK